MCIKLHAENYSTEFTHHSGLIAAPKRQAYCGCVPAGSEDGVNENGTQVAEKQLVGHKVTCIQNDLGQQVEEESGRKQFESLCLVCSPDHSSQNKAHDDEHSTLWDHTGDMMV